MITFILWVAFAAGVLTWIALFSILTAIHNLLKEKAELASALNIEAMSRAKMNMEMK
jgi:hypothetical protein